MALDGLLLVDKESGCTSHDVVQSARRILRQKRIGHCGTLDPDATGLLLLTVGLATRLTRFLIHAPKTYEGTIRFGVTTDTYDAGGRVVDERSPEGIDLDGARSAMDGFVGTIEQRLPAYSARKVQGVRLYELARRGEEVPESSKTVTVYEFGATGPIVEAHLGFRLACSSGTYARSLAHDLGQVLGCGAHLATLRRSRVGPFAIESALRLEEIEQRRRLDQDLGPAWMPLAEIPLPFSTATLDAQQERRALHGQTIVYPGLPAEAGDWVRLVERGGALLGVGAVIERLGGSGVAVIQPKVVFKTAPTVVSF